MSFRRWCKTRERDDNGRQQTRWVENEVRRPNPVGEYNQHMGGVDKSDQLIASYNCLIKCRRWWKTLAFHMIDVACVNSYLLFKEFCRRYPDNPDLRAKAKYTPLKFREELCKHLAGITDAEFVPVPDRENRNPHPERAFVTGLHIPQYTEQDRMCRLCYWKTKNKNGNKSHYRCKAESCWHSGTKNGFYLCIQGHSDTQGETALRSGTRQHGVGRGRGDRSSM